MDVKIDLKAPAWTAGLAAMACGTVTHLFGLVTMLHNNDDIGQLPGGYGTGITSGRWLLTILGDGMVDAGLSYNLPLVNGLLFLLLISLCAVIVTAVFRIRSRGLSALLGMLFAVFPPVAATMFFRYTVVYYGISMLLAVSAVWLTERYKFGGIPGAVCLALSMGIYQAYVPFAITMFVLLLIRRILDGEGDFAGLVKRGVYYCLILGLGVVLYFLFLKVCLALYGTQLSDYNGVNNMGKLSLAELPLLLKKTVYDVCMLPRKNYCGLAGMKWLQIGYVLLGVLAAAALAWVLIKKVRKPLLIALTVVLCALLPVAVNFIRIMCSNGWVYTLMVYPFVLIPVLPVLALEAIPEEKLQGLGRKALAVVLAAMVFCYAYETNVNYTSLYYSDRQTENYLNGMVAQIRMTEGFTPDKKWAFIGEIQDPMLRSPWQYEVLYGGNEAANLLVNRPTRWHWFQMYCGITVPLAEEAAVAELSAMEEVKAMPCWPSEGSVKVIGDAVVIKCQEIQ